MGSLVRPFTQSSLCQLEKYLIVKPCEKYLNLSQTIVTMMGADSKGRKLLFPKVLPPKQKLPTINGFADHEKQGHSQTEIETEVASFRALLLRQLNNNDNNNRDNNVTNITTHIEVSEQSNSRKLSSDD